ncbi:hypothetical protein LMIY3S_05695 [Labrys miyagiensis]
MRARLDFPQPELADQSKDLAPARLQRDRLVGHDGSRGAPAEGIELGDVVHIERALRCGDRGTVVMTGWPRRLDLVPAHAAHGVSLHAGFLQRDRLCAAARRQEMIAARTEKAALRALLRHGNLPLDRHEGARTLVGEDIGNAAQQPLRIGVARMPEELGGRRLLDDLARIHDADAVARRGDQAKIVGNIEETGAVAMAQVADEVKNRSFDGHVEAGGGLVQQQQCRPRKQGHGDDDALLLAARQLMRITPEDVARIRQADVLDHRRRHVHGLAAACAEVTHRHFCELGADGLHWIESAHRFLVDHGDPPPADRAQHLGPGADEFAPFEADATRRHAAIGAEVTHHRHGRGRLAAAGFAHQAIGLPRGDMKGNVGHREHRLVAPPELDAQVADFQQRTA